jgi:hypothetical protein
MLTQECLDPGMVQIFGNVHIECETLVQMDVDSQTPRQSLAEMFLEGGRTVVECPMLEGGLIQTKNVGAVSSPVGNDHNIGGRVVERRLLRTRKVLATGDHIVETRGFDDVSMCDDQIDVEVSNANGCKGFLE